MKMKINSFPSFVLVILTAFVLLSLLVGPEAIAEDQGQSDPAVDQFLNSGQGPDDLKRSFDALTPDQRQQVTDRLQNRLNTFQPQSGENGGGGSGGSGGGGGGGSQLAQLAFGVAAIIAATQPAISAAIQAGADKAIAAITAKSQKDQTDTVSKTVLGQAKIEAGEATKFSQDAKDLQAIGQQGSLKREGKELDAAADARKSKLAQDSREFDESAKVDEARIEIAAKTASATIAQDASHFRILETYLASLMPKPKPSLSVTRMGGASSAGSGSPTQRLLANATAPQGKNSGRPASMLSILRGSSPSVRHRAPASQSLALASADRPRAVYAPSERRTLAPIPEATEPDMALRSQGVSVRHGQSYPVDGEGAAATSVSSSDDE
jgi:hypothetical protein